MVDDTTASVIALHQPRPKRAKISAERAKAYRQRKKASVPAVVAQVSTTLSESGKVTPVTPVTPPTIASGARHAVTTACRSDPVDGVRVCARGN